MNVAVAVAVAVVLAVLVIVAARAVRPAAAPAGPRTPAAEVAEGRATVVLDVEQATPEAPGVQRLVAETASRVLQARPDVEEVRVVARSGALLGRHGRSSPALKAIELPGFLLEPHHRPRAPQVATELGEEAAAGRGGAPARFVAADRPSPPRPLADLFDLPTKVRRLVRAPDDAVDVVRAILEAAGVACEVRDDLVRAGADAVVVLRTPVGDVVSPDSLNHAYLRFQSSGAHRGIVLTPGILYPNEIRRRELLAPALLHAGPDGIQRMADAVELGADPLRFAIAPPTL